jgi:HPt (histidine-containing phosphotransfer) domain-containing protein
MSDTDPTSLPVLDPATLGELQEIMGEGFFDLLKTFLRDMPIQVADIRAAADQGDAAALYCSAHKLKSGSGAIGALQLAELARQLENLGRRGTLANIGPLLQQAQASAEQTSTVLQALLPD